MIPPYWFPRVTTSTAIGARDTRRRGCWFHGVTHAVTPMVTAKRPTTNAATWFTVAGWGARRLTTETNPPRTKRDAPRRPRRFGDRADAVPGPSETSTGKSRRTAPAITRVGLARLRISIGERF